MKKTKSRSLEAVFGPLVSIYNRADAISDGVLIDVTTMAREAGLQWPVALTYSVWRDCVSWDEQRHRSQVCQDEDGRLWDVLFMAVFVIRRAAVPKDRMTFTLYRVPSDGYTLEPEEVTLKLVVGPGDTGEPMVTILMPDED
ncbi:hypothetical protein G8770_16160 [Aestuariicella hydrocarbonica]|uniref:Uncharacterized protein n=1 Tax=Pseudomaricurvus hydrocarbonicus TaxID=1470433 RepID=A0A9E5T3E6_9GAMM|nr:DUF6573 family protein [Aestuariicella hydrocarbonica]NHO67082.1 hypothetical protein [Aestuariicella hydrocarbonica]